MIRNPWTALILCCTAVYGSSVPINANIIDQSCPYSSQCNSAINEQHIDTLMTYVDSEKNPCNDFYAYACGKWREKHGTQSTATAISESQINGQYEDLFTYLLSNLSSPEHLYPMYGKVLTHYQNCTALDKPNLRRYIELLGEDMLSSLNCTHWMNVLAVLGRYGYHGHFVQLEVRWYNASQHMIFLLPHNHHESLSLTTEIYNALSQDGSYWPPLHQIQEQFRNLEKNLVRLAKSPTADDTFRNYRLDQIRTEVTGLKWDEVLRKQLGRSIPADHIFQVDDLDAINRIVKYLNNRDTLLLNRYSLARFLSHLMGLPHNPLATWDAKQRSRGRDCIRHMRRSLYLPMNYVYERSFYTQRRNSDELVIHSVFEQLQDQLELRVQYNEFNLSQELVMSLREKVHKMRINVGNLPTNVSEQFYWDSDRRWTVGHNFYENHLNSLLYYYTLVADLEGSTNMEDRKIWYSFNMHTPEFPDNIDATPYFYCLGNIILVPYSYLKRPFFHAGFWPALLYGDLGNTLGHEMMHAFDTDLVDYDGQGNLRNFSEQLGQVELYNRAVGCLNSSAVMLNERTSDVSGSRLALQTYGGNWLTHSDNGRLYFLQFAHFFCGDEGDKYHDSGKQRLNYSLSQVSQFAEVFECHSGTGMTSSNQCPFW
ncbi:membrane metallo-endopeptidase-like 1 [Drosophila eugracilis]|uniref:membrane metallo-endopeptidase-like 1 n=1 Tax=Drosophila eugracilis TaxID=29029 RepID=UPI001BD9FB01|nr:membrane metallo-endopeptidase-like 1 [Drosophila eugracilis]